MSSHGRVLFRGWYWFNQRAAMYGWVPLAIGLLVWDYFVWKEARPKVKGWFTRKLLTFSLAAGVAPLLPWWIPAGQPPSQFFDMIGRHPGVPVMLAWSVVLFVTVLLCIRSEEHTSELQSQSNLVCRLLLEKKKTRKARLTSYAARACPATDRSRTAASSSSRSRSGKPALPGCSQAKSWSPPAARRPLFAPR